jgi:predicted metal-dependent phosphoesterase TrpH
MGAMISVPHPFDRWRAGAWREADLEAILPLIDAIEVFNARCIFAGDNARALDFARRHNLPTTVGSDAHLVDEIGHAMLCLPQRPTTGAELLAGLAQATAVCQPTTSLVHVGNILSWAAREATQSLRHWRSCQEP